MAGWQEDAHVRHGEGDISESVGEKGGRSRGCALREGRGTARGGAGRIEVGEGEEEEELSDRGEQNRGKRLLMERKDVGEQSADEMNQNRTEGFGPLGDLFGAGMRAVGARWGLAAGHPQMR